MLILTRRVGESLMIGDDVTITVLGVKGNQVRIGVKAPKEVAVHREEILNRIEEAAAEDKSKTEGMPISRSVAHWPHGERRATMSSVNGLTIPLHVTSKPRF